MSPPVSSLVSCFCILLLDCWVDFPNITKNLWKLADLYDEVTIPPELRRAHQENDRAVMRAYGFSVKDTTETSCVAALMKMYQDLTKNKE